ncbi:MAG: lysine exporter LysO family protein [Bacteroidales bacterium]|nr:lysine exporter LysO family protein [Bacteroidales bacterium]
MRGSLTILCFFSVGLLLGYSNALPDFLIKNDYSSYTLYFLMFLVGIGIGADSKAFEVLKSFNLKIILIPLTTIVGTALGISLIFLILPGLSFKEVQAVGAGYGYYSLSSIIITETYSKTIGVVALLSNVMREIMTLLLAPIMVTFFGKIAPICSGGATSMDTTLPIITTVSGKEYAIISLFHGIVLTILVPFIVSLLLAL